MASYDFDKMAKKAGVESSFHARNNDILTEEEGKKRWLSMTFRFSITDNYLSGDGGPYDYVFDFPHGHWERTEWKNGIPHASEREIPKEAMIRFAESLGFLFTLSQKQSVTNTKSLEINTDAYEKEKYGPIKRLTRCELRAEDRFFRWVAEKDKDTPFPEIYRAFAGLRKSVECR